MTPPGGFTPLFDDFGYPLVAVDEFWEKFAADLFDQAEAAVGWDGPALLFVMMSPAATEQKLSNPETAEEWGTLPPDAFQAGTTMYGVHCVGEIEGQPYEALLGERAPEGAVAVALMTEGWLSSAKAGEDAAAIAAQLGRKDPVTEEETRLARERDPKWESAERILHQLAQERPRPSQDPGRVECRQMTVASRSGTVTHFMRIRDSDKIEQIDSPGGRIPSALMRYIGADIAPPLVTPLDYLHVTYLDNYLAAIRDFKSRSKELASLRMQRDRELRTAIKKAKRAGDTETVQALEFERATLDEMAAEMASGDMHTMWLAMARVIMGYALEAFGVKEPEPPMPENGLATDTPEPLRAEVLTPGISQIAQWTWETALETPGMRALWQLDDKALFDRGANWIAEEAVDLVPNLNTVSLELMDEVGPETYAELTARWVEWGLIPSA
jgi:hypothetical protein